jgi:hypothetical protein
MRIEWSLDGDSTPLEPVGDIRIIDETGTEISETATMLDAWFTALVQFAYASASTSIDLVDEPDPLLVSLALGRVSLSYRGQSVSSASVRECRNAVKSSVELFLQELRSRHTSGQLWPQILAELEHGRAPDSGT